MSMMIQAALNGDRQVQAHPTLPLSPRQLSEDAMACARAGAELIHLHPRDSAGYEHLTDAVINRVVRRVKIVSGVPVGVSTGEWIQPDLRARLNDIREWNGVDYASVNLCEPGAEDVMDVLTERGIGIEAGVGTIADIDRLKAYGRFGGIARILVEPWGDELRSDAEDALRYVRFLHDRLDAIGITAPRLQHTEGRHTWLLVEDALRRGLDTRIGLEDTLLNPDGSRTSGNAELVRHAARIRQSLLARDAA